jgi:predicted methyltransferase
VCSRLLSALALLALTAACRSDAAPASPEPAPAVERADEGGPEAAAEASAGAEEGPTIAAIVDAGDRTEADRAIDPQRKPAELLAFLDLEPGMKVADLMAGFGYTTELLARAVGPEGVVYGQNNTFVLERFAEAGWSERLARDAMANAVRVDRELDDPLPPEAKDLDAVVMVLFYHDTVWMKTDRAAMNQAIFDALRLGGAYVLIDHSGREGTGTGEAESLHRIEEAVVRQEIEAAGFEFAAEADFLRNPEDPRDWNAAPRAAAEAGKRGESDRFVLKFVKPQ